MNIRNKFSRMLCISMILSMLAFAVAEENPLYVLIALGAILLGWALNESPKENVTGQGRAGISLPRWASTTGLGVVVLGSVLRGYLLGDAIAAFSWLLACILLIKTWEVRRTRDYGQMLTVSIFLTISTTLADNSLGLGVLILLHVPVALWGVMLYQLLLSRERMLGDDGEEDDETPRSLATQREGALTVRAQRGLRNIGLGSLVVATALATLAFLFIPRGFGGRQFGGFGQLNMGRSTGFVDEVDLSQGGTISESQTPIMTVELLNSMRQNIGGEERPLYLRGSVLDTYQRKEWKRADIVNFERVEWRSLTPSQPASDLTMKPRLKRERRGRYTPPDLIDQAGRQKPILDVQEEVIQRIVTRQPPTGDAPLFALLRPRWITIPSGATIRHDRATGWIGRERDSTPFQDAASRASTTIEYEVSSMPYLESDSTYPDPASRETITFDSEIIRAKASEILRDAGIAFEASLRPISDDETAAQRLADYLRREFEYTLDVPRPPIKADPIEWFVTESQMGHCELFASALTALCRGAGIEARLIAGYLTNEFDASTGLYTARQSNAHAWCEVHVGNGRWITIDPTPPSSLMAMREQHKGLFTKLSHIMADLRDRWNMNIVLFDQSTQQRMMGLSPNERPWFARVADSLRDQLGRERERTGIDTAPFWIQTGALTVAGMVLVGGVIASIWIIKKLRRVPQQNAGWGLNQSNKAKRLHAAVKRTLKSVGAQQPAAVPLGMHAIDVGRDHPAIGAAVKRAADALYAASFGLNDGSKGGEASRAANHRSWDKTLEKELDDALEEVLKVKG